MGIHDQRDQHHTNISKQTTLMAGVDVALPDSAAKSQCYAYVGVALNGSVHKGMNHIGKCKGSCKDSQWKCKY